MLPQIKNSMKLTNKVKIDQLFESLLKNPTYPKVYRDFVEYYSSMNMKNESKAFVDLLEVLFKEQYDLNTDIN